MMLDRRSLWLLLGAPLAVACFSNATEPVTLTHPTGADVDSVFVDFRPYGVAITKSDVALVTQLDAHSVSSARLTPPAVMGTVAVGNVPTGIAVDPTGTTALVTNQHDFTIGIIDIASGVQTKTLPAESNTFRAIFNSTGSHAYATQVSGTVLAIDMVQQTIVDNVTTAGGNGIALSGDTLLIVTSTSGQFAYIDTRTFEETKRVSTGVTLQDVVVSHDGTKLYIAVEFGAGIQVRSLASGALLHTIPVDGGAFGLAMSPDGQQLWATTPYAFPEGGGVSVFDIASGALLKRIPAQYPRRIAFNRSGTVAVVSDESGWVYFIR